MSYIRAMYRHGGI